MLNTPFTYQAKSLMAAKAKFVIVIFYGVGALGLLLPFTFPLFVRLIPFALLFSVVLLGLFHQDRPGRKHGLVFSAIVVFSFLIEMVGVNTGRIFGDYQYGQSLGIKLAETPVIIGLNWLLLVYATSSVFEVAKLHCAAKVVGASVLMVVYDAVLEQVAPKMDMWHWSNGVVPFQNYVSWGLIALVFHALVKAFRLNTANKLGAAILAAQFLFFLVLAIFLK